MAAQSYYQGDELEDDTSDIGKLWGQALLNYKQKCGVDLSASGREKWNMTTIEAEQEQHLALFKKFRHDDSVVDRLRSLVSRNTKIIQKVAEHVCNAASSAFPPSAAILTAFNYCLNASKVVSEDYDMIVSFFDIMNSFLERMLLLEDRLPPDRAYQTFLVRVFNALLEVCAIAKNYRDQDHGRLRKWAKAMLEGSDSKLQGAYGKITTEIQNLESATVVMTLKTAIDSSKKLDATNKKLGDLQQGQQEMVRLEKEIRTLTMDNNAVSNQTLTFSKRSVVLLENLVKKQTEVAASQQVDAGARKSTALLRLKTELRCWADVAGQFDGYKKEYVPNTFDWITNEPGYKQISADETRLWCITGPAGIGKSTLMGKTYLSLQNDFSGEGSTSVGYFFFRGDLRGLNYTTNMMRWCALQMAEKDERYREDILTEIQRGGSLYEFDTAKTIERMWSRLFTSKYAKNAGRRVILVLDGVDQVTEGEDGKKLLEFIRQVAGSDHKIQIIFTAAATYSLLGDESLKTVCLEMNKDKLSPDMRKVAWERTKRLPRLKNMNRKVRFKIAKELAGKADTMTYIHHMLRRLENIGREGPILKELRQLPPDTAALYEVLLKDCTRNRSAKEMELLRKIFAWIAYAKTLIGLPLLGKILETGSGESIIDIEEEVAYRSSRLIRVYNDARIDEENATDEEDKEKNDEKDDSCDEEDDPYADFQILIGFHDQSLKLFFRQQDINGHKLRCSPSKGNLMVFQDIWATLIRPQNKKQTPEEIGTDSYASKYWVDHLRDIDRKDLTDEEAAKVVEYLNDILQNKGGSVRRIESMAAGNFTVLGESKEEAEKSLDTISLWAEHAMALPESSLTTSDRETMAAIVRDKRQIYVLFARGHIFSWFNAGQLNFNAIVSFRLAHKALRQCKDLLHGNTELQTYLEEFTADETWNFDPPEKSFIILANAFPDIQKTPKAYRSIATVMSYCDYIKPSIDLFRSCVASTTDKEDLFQLHSALGRILFQTDEDERLNYDPSKIRRNPYEGEDEAAKTARIYESLEHLNKAIAAKPTSFDKNSEDDWDLTSMLSDAHQRRVRVYLELGDMSSLLWGVGAYIEEMKAFADRKYLGADLSAIVPALAKRGQWADILRMMRMINAKDRVRYFDMGSWDFPWNPADVEHAAVETGETAYLLQLFEEVDKEMTTKASWGQAPFLVRWADFHSTVLRTAGSTATAKALLARVLDRPKDERFTDTISRASQHLADIVLQEFREAKDAKGKTASFDEMKILARRMADFFGKGFDPTQSQLSIPLALMTRRMGPTADYAFGLDAVFKGCVDALKDSIGWNDLMSFRMLAKVLMCAPPSKDGYLEREAQVAATCQLYIVDMDIWKKEQEDGGKSAEEKAKRAVESEKMEKVDEDLDPTAYLDCCGCGKKISNWHDGAVYMCCYCTAMDFCQKCFDKRAAVERGEGTDWRVLCPKGHKHVKIPAEDWRGVKGGVLKMDKDIKFGAWLDELKVKWAATWEIFWEETV